MTFPRVMNCHAVQWLKTTNCLFSPLFYGPAVWTGLRRMVLLLVSAGLTHEPVISCYSVASCVSWKWLVINQNEKGRQRWGLDLEPLILYQTIPGFCIGSSSFLEGDWKCQVSELGLCHFYHMCGPEQPKRPSQNQRAEKYILPPNGTDCEAVRPFLLFSPDSKH